MRDKRRGEGVKREGVERGEEGKRVEEERGKKEMSE